MERQSWWRRAGRWFRGVETVDAAISLSQWFLRVGGPLLALLGTFVGGAIGAIIGSPAFVPIAGGAAIGLSLGGSFGVIIAARLRALFPPGSGVLVQGANGYLAVAPITPGASSRAKAGQTLATELDATKAMLEAERQAHEREREAHRQTEARATALAHEIRYDIRERRTFPPLSEVALELAHNDMTKVRRALVDAGQRALALAQGLAHSMQSGQDERNRVIGRYFGEHRVQPTSRLFHRLMEELGVAEQFGRRRFDYREWLIHYYEAYNELRRTIKQMADFTGVRLADLDGYREWRDADRTFLAKVGEIGVMHDVVEAVNERRQYPLPMPD